MDKFFSSIISLFYRLILTIIISGMFIVIPQKNGWSAENAESERREAFQQSLQLQKSGNTDCPSDNLEVYPPPSPITSHKIPKWGFYHEEIEQLFQNSKDFVCIIEYGGCFQRLNKSWTYLLGWRMHELLETPYINFVHPEDVEKTLKHEKRGTLTFLINRYRCRDGSYRWLDWVGLSMIGGNEVTGENRFLCIAKDITLQKVLENELYEKIKKTADEEWYIKQKVLEAITEIQAAHIRSIFHGGDEQSAYTPVLQVMLQNFIKLSESNLGYICEITYDIIDIPIVNYVWGGDFFLRKEEISLPNKIIETAKKLEGISNNFTEDIFSTKEPLVVSDITSYTKKIEIPPDLPPLKSFLGFPIIFKGKLLGVIGLFNHTSSSTDESLMEFLNPISLLSGRLLNEKKMLLFQKEAERKEAENQERARKQAEAENAAKSSFLAHMSHEIRTPLSGLLGMLEFINQDSLQEEDLNYLKMAHGSGLTLLSILNDILDTSKIHAGQLSLEKIKFNPVGVAQEVTELLSLDAKKREVEVKLITSPLVPSNLMGDPTRLRQVFFNLVGNAIKFTRKGSVLVSLDGAHDGEHFMLSGSITDTGIGISPEAQEKLFRSFTQADTSMLRRFGGTGLGLFITKQLCKMMEGDIKVSSELGKGSTFSFHIRLDRPPELKPQGEQQSSIPDKLPNIKILVAEDNAVNQLVLKTMLTRAGCTVTCVWNGEEAVRAISVDHYDIILMDGEMPVMSGFEAARKIREAFSDQAAPPIIAVTAHAMTEDRERFLEAGMSGYLTKPIQKNALYVEIMRCLEILPATPN